MLKALNLPGATVWKAPDLLKVLPILSDRSFRTSALDWKILKPYWKYENRLHFSHFSHFHISHFLNIPKYRETTDETFQQSRKQDSFKHILKSSANMCESLGLEFFRTITGIQSGPDTFDESRLVMTFLN